MRSAALTLVVFLTLPVMAQFKFQAVDVPGAVETQVRGINNSGEVVGFYRAAADNCIPFATPNVQVPPCDEHGFKIIDGVLTTMNVPDSSSTAIMAVNDTGDMVGYYTKTSDTCVVEQHGFIWTHQNVIKDMDYSDLTGFCGTDALWTIPFGINNAGVVVGAVWSVLDGQPWGGFIYRNRTFHAIDETGVEGCLSCTMLTGISSGDLVVGNAYRVFGVIPMWTAFMKRSNDDLFFARSQDDTWVTSVNSAGDVVGYGIYGAGFFISGLKSYLHNSSVAFLPPVTGVGYPDAVATFPFTVNNRHTLGGTYMTVDGSLHGFVAASVSGHGSRPPSPGRRPAGR